ncbi:GNAT family N-acetyltransferase [Paenibacillus albidus]|uniref:GNAT family N-acetyltransferase n=1 Tax=Paenibacillus albidus TaxID=2041023 RepID=UPI001BE9AD29|nr:GNAT family N-acetyltransferase [Paenibacillus albidus]MBT2287817.1 GNAT family N-acetyltransferase [Paenibacillus albidus]
MIREATANDAEYIEGLYRLLLPDHPDIRVTPQRLGEISNNPDSFLYVYEVDHLIVGTVHLHLCMDALSGERPFAVIERMIVTPEMRGAGYGAALMDHAEKRAAARGALKVMLSSAAGRAEAHVFYERLGYDGNGSKLFKKYL